MNGRLPLAFVVTACAALASAPAPAQEFDVFRLARGERLDPLKFAKKAIDQGEFTDAVEHLGRLLVPEEFPDPNGEDDGQDYFVGPVDQSGPRASLKKDALRLLGENKEVREAFELRLGATARAQLDEALAGRDVVRLRDIARKYFHTQAGYEASLLLGRYELEQGHALAAAVCLQRVQDAPGAGSRYEPDLSILLASCWYYAELPERARETLVALRKRSPDLRIRVRDGQTKLFEDDAQALAWLKELLGERRPLRLAEVAQWAMFRGDAQRNARNEGDMPLFGSRWRLPVCNDPNDLALVEKITKRYHEGRKLPLQSTLHPLAVHSYVLMRTPQKLIGVDFESGKRIWEWPLDDVDRSFSPYAMNRGELREQELRQRLWQDAPFGHLSSDGRFVYAIDKLGTQTTQRHQVMMMAGGFPQQQPGSAKPHNELVALDLAAEGKLRWIVGGESGEMEPKLAGAFFLGPPLPLQGELFAMAELRGEIRLVVLNADNGRLVWWQQVAHVDSQSILNDPLRRSGGASPSYADGIVVCPTSAGAVAAIDLASRSLLWGFQYKRPVSNPNVFMFGMPQMQSPIELGNGWSDASATIADGCVLIAPVEHDRAFCIDLLTGKHKWRESDKEGLPRGEMLYNACVHGGNAIFVGKSAMHAFRLENGQPAWSSPVSLPSGQMPSGRGYASRDSYFLPITGAELLKVDLARGVIDTRRKTETTLGNLVCYRNQVISQGADFLTVFYQSDALRAEVAERLLRDEKDVWALTRKGELLLQDGKKAESLAALRQAYTIAREKQDNPDEVQSVLVRALLTVLRDDFRANREIAAEIATLVEDPQQHREFLRLMSLGLKQQGEVAEAFETLVRLAEVLLRDEDSAVEQGVEYVSHQHKVRQDRWVRMQLAELSAAADPKARDRIRQVIETRMEAALADPSSATLKRFVNLFGHLPTAGRARLALAGRLIEGGETLRAQALLLGLEESAEEAVAGASVAEMARLLENAKLYDQALAQYERLGGRWDEIAVRGTEKGRDVLASVRSRPLYQQPLQARLWPSGQTTAGDRNPPVPLQMYDRSFSAAILESRGPVPEGLSVHYHQQQNAIVVRDGRGQDLLRIGQANERRRFFATDFSYIHAKAHGHLLVVAIGVELVAIDLLKAGKGADDAAVLWRQPLVEELTPNPQFGGMHHINVTRVTNPFGGARLFAMDGRTAAPVGSVGPVTAHGVCFQRQSELLCVDPLTGQTLWSREGIEQGADLFGDDELLFVATANGEEARVFGTMDGSDRGKRKVARRANRWATNGRRLLSWRASPDNSQYFVSLTDIESEKTIWEERVSITSKGTLIGTDEVALVSQESVDGKLVPRLTIRSLTSDQIRLRRELPGDIALGAVHVLRDAERYLVGLSEPVVNTTPGEVLVQAMGNTALMRGRLYSFDRHTGEPRWSVPATIDRQGWVQDQPVNSPVLVFLRTVVSMANKPNRESTSVLCIDRRDGRVVLNRDAVPNRAQTFRISVNPADRTVAVIVPNATLEVKYSDKLAPPEPPIQAIGP